MLSGYRRLERQALSSLEFKRHPERAKVKIYPKPVNDYAKTKSTSFADNQKYVLKLFFVNHFFNSSLSSLLASSASSIVA